MWKEFEDKDRKGWDYYLGTIKVGRVIDCDSLAYTPKPEERWSAAVFLPLRKGTARYYHPYSEQAKMWVEDQVETWLSDADLKVRNPVKPLDD